MKVDNLLDQMFEIYVSDRYPVLDRLDSRLVGIHITIQSMHMNNVQSMLVFCLQPETLRYFCFPNGLKLSSTRCESRFHSFVHTSEDGSHIIGIF